MPVLRRQRLLFISHSSGAFLNHHLPLAEAMRGEMETHVALPCASAAEARRIEGCSITLHPINWNRKTINPFRVAGEVCAVRKLIAAIKPDIVNAINIKGLLVTALAMRFPWPVPARLVGTVTGLGYMFSGESIKRKLLRGATMAALRHTLSSLRHTLVFSNTDDRDLFAAHRVGKPGCARVIPVPGVDSEIFSWSPEPQHGFRVILPGRMLWEKGVGDFVAAAGILRGRGINAECILVGGVDADNPTGIEAKQLQQWHEAGEISWLGHHDDMPALLASANVVCLPSFYREGFPRALSEAMACGRAVVTTDMPGCRDAVLGLDSGLLVPPRNVMALADALELLWKNSDMRREMGQRGREAVAARFSQHAITAAMKGVLMNDAA